MELHILLLGYTELDQRRNTDIKEGWKVQKVVADLRIRKVMKVIKRMQNSKLPNLAMYYVPTGKRNKDRSRRSWIDEFWDES
jgi:hypothetical protein